MERKLSKIYTSYNKLTILMILGAIICFSNCKAEEIIADTNDKIIVIDGDSLEIGNNRIRLMGIDAPEYLQYCKDKNKKKYDCGKISKNYLKSLIQNKQITCKIHKKDQYERDLCTCYTDNININAEMIRQGHAVVYMESPYQKEQQEAKQYKRGIWQGKFMHPRLFRKLKEAQK